MVRRLFMFTKILVIYSCVIILVLPSIPFYVSSFVIPTSSSGFNHNNNNNKRWSNQGKVMKVVIDSPNPIQQLQKQRKQEHYAIPDPNIILDSFDFHSLSSFFSLLALDPAPPGGVQVFDGSDIIDTQVVSNVFWQSLQTKILSIFIGQILSGLVFALLISQFNNVTAWVGQSVSKLFNAAQDSARQNQVKEKITSVSQTVKEKIESTPSSQIDLRKLLICILIDVIGTSSELLPILGEVTDIVYAPLAAVILRELFGSNNIILGLEFLEEILPFTDIIPLATLCWIVETYYPDSSIAEALKLGDFAPNRFSTNDGRVDNNGIIDVEIESKRNRDDDMRRF